MATFLLAGGSDMQIQGQPFKPNPTRAIPPAPASALASAAAPTAPQIPADVDMDPETDLEKKADSNMKEGRDIVAIEDLTLPKSIITRLAKGVLPPNTQIQANAILAMSKSATVFINHLANAANGRALSTNKKTILPIDVFEALRDIEFTDFTELIQNEFNKFNEIQTTKRNVYRRRVAAAKKSQPSPSDPDASTHSAPPTRDTSFSADTLLDASSAIPRHKRQKPNASGDSVMVEDPEDTPDASDGEDDPDEEEEQDDGDNADDNDEDEIDDDTQEEEHDALEELDQRAKADEALDNGEDSD